jgi:hypothetical protein
MGGQEFVDRLHAGIAAWTEILSGLGGNAELRTYSAPYYRSWYRFDNQGLVAMHQFGDVGTNSPILKVSSGSDLWVPMTAHMTRMWDAATEVPLSE